MANNAKDVMSSAISQIGYSRWSDPNTGTKYGRWYEDEIDRTSGNYDFGANGVPYCAMFVSWNFDQADAKCAGIPGAYCPSILAVAKSKGKLIDKSEARYGDVVLFDWEGDGTSDHVGLVEVNHPESSYMQCVEGNTNNGAVARRTRAYSTIIGVIRPDYDDSSSNGSASSSSAKPSVGRTLRNGSKGEDVKTLQRTLIAKGFSCGSYGVDGSFGPDTEKAVRAYQKANGLEVDGIAGPLTQGSLYG